MNPHSLINKGKRFEKYINNQIEQMGFGKAIRTPGSGSGKIKGDSFNNLPFLIEAKNQKTIHLLDWIDQSKREAQEGNWDKNKWALIIRDPRYPEFDEVYAVIEFHEFLELLKKDSEPLVKEPDRELAYQLKILKENIKRVLNKLE